jgi:dTDP-4-dehydrorhamnose reductase
MKILITGANGFAGYYFVQTLLSQNHIVIATGKGECRLPFSDQPNFVYEEMDFTNPYVIDTVFYKYKPDVVIHSGAIGKPDDCEKDQVQAYIVNVEGTVHLMMNAAEYKSFFIFISTDFVFDGEAGMYKEEDERHPVNYYGRTKMEAEDAVMDYEYDWCIVRTVLVYGKPQAGRDNILTVIKNKLKKGEGYNVFDDQVRTPTYVEDLSAAVAAIIKKRATGVYHISGEDVLTPYEMAVQAAEFLNLDKSLLKKVVAADMPQPAIRPLKTGFNIDKAKRDLGFKPTSFSEGLRKTCE